MCVFEYRLKQHNRNELKMNKLCAFCCKNRTYDEISLILLKCALFGCRLSFVIKKCHLHSFCNMQNGIVLSHMKTHQKKGWFHWIFTNRTKKTQFKWNFSLVINKWITSEASSLLSSSSESHRILCKWMVQVFNVNLHLKLISCLEINDPFKIY